MMHATEGQNLHVVNSHRDEWLRLEEQKRNDLLDEGC